MVFALHGVHGGGKTFVARPIAEDIGARFVVTDAAERFPDVISFRPELRQYVYLYDTLSGFSYALGLAQQGEAVFLDFGPLHSIPYIKWFLRDGGNEHIQLVREGEKRLRERSNAKVVNVFFVVEKNYERVIERIRRRARPGFVKEELDINYLRYIDTEMKQLIRQLQDEGQDVEIVPADASIAEKVARLWEITTSYL